MSRRIAPFGIGLSLSIAVAALPARSASAVTPLSSYREVVTFGAFVLQGETSGPFEVDERPSNELGSYDDAASTSISAGGTFVAATASQSSDWGTALFTFEAAFQCQAGLDSLDVFAEGFGDAIAAVHFQVDQPTTAVLAGILTAAGNGNSSLQLEREESTSLVVFSAANGTTSIDESILLEPGIYILRLVTGGYGREFPGQGSSPASGSIVVTVTFSTSTSAPNATAGTGPAVTLHPNPMREGAVIRLGRSIPLGTPLRVFDAKGRLVRTLGPALGGPLAWDARDDSGMPLATGVYFVRAGTAPAVRTTIVR